MCLRSISLVMRGLYISLYFYFLPFLIFILNWIFVVHMSRKSESNLLKT